MKASLIPPVFRNPNRGKCGYVDFRSKTQMPVRDTYKPGNPVAFVVDIYGWTGADVCRIPGGSDPMVAAIKRMGLDPMRYQAILWDVQL